MSRRSARDPEAGTDPKRARGALFASAVCAACFGVLTSCGSPNDENEVDSASVEFENEGVANAEDGLCRAAPQLVVLGGHERELAAGRYGSVRLFPSRWRHVTRLMLTGGDYVFRSLELGTGARLECAAKCSIQVVGRLRGGDGVYVGPKEQSCVNPADVSVYTSARDRLGFGARGPAFVFGDRTQLECIVQAPRATLAIGDDAFGRADLLAAKVVLGERTPFTSAGTPFDFDDQNPCTTDACDFSTGSARHDPVTNGTSCDDGDACTLYDACFDGVCERAPVTCPPPAACRNVGRCNSATGECEYAPLANGTACDDGEVCTTGEACQGGLCGGGSATPCFLNACFIGACTPGVGCVYSPAPGAVCSPGNVGGQTCATMTNGAKPYGHVVCGADCQLDSSHCGAAPPTIVLSCNAHMGAGAMVSRQIDSYGADITYYSMFPSPSDPVNQLSQGDLDALLAAAAALEVSTAGYDIYHGPQQHLMTHDGWLYTFGPAHQQTLVASFVDGQSVGYRETHRSRDPAALVALRFACGEVAWETSR